MHRENIKIPSHINISDRINFVFCSLYVTKNIIQSIIYQFLQLELFDHRIIFIDVTILFFIHKSPIDITYINHREIGQYISQNISKYKEI